jgi:hypothetical protein
MPKVAIRFTGVTLKTASRTASEGTLKFRANLTAEVIKKLGWGELTKGQTSADMECSITDALMVLEAGQDGLFSAGEGKFEVQRVGSFKAQRLELKNKKGKGFRFVLDFEARFIAEGILAQTETWLVTVGAGEARMTVSGMLVEPEEEKGEESE